MMSAESLSHGLAEIWQGRDRPDLSDYVVQWVFGYHSSVVIAPYMLLEAVDWIRIGGGLSINLHFRLL